MYSIVRLILKEDKEKIKNIVFLSFYVKTLYYIRLLSN